MVSSRRYEVVYCSLKNSTQILHRDIKPGNVLIYEEPLDSGNFIAKVSDLGLGRLQTGGPLTMFEGRSWSLRGVRTLSLSRLQ